MSLDQWNKHDLQDLVSSPVASPRVKAMAEELLARRERDEMHAAAVCVARRYMSRACDPPKALRQALVRFVEAEAALGPQPDWIDRAVDGCSTMVCAPGEKTYGIPLVDVVNLKRRLREAYNEEEGSKTCK